MIRDVKYNILILLGYQSIHEKYEPAHEIFIPMTYTLSHPLYMHAQLSSGGCKKCKFWLNP